MRRSSPTIATNVHRWAARALSASARLVSRPRTALPPTATSSPAGDAQPHAAAGPLAGERLVEEAFGLAGGGVGREERELPALADLVPRRRPEPQPGQ